MKLVVYGLLAEGEYIRYIGVTKRSLALRLREHIREAENGSDSHKALWLRKCLQESRAVRIVRILEIDESEWDRWEQAFIAHIPNLTNMAVGGHRPSHTPASCAKRSRALKGRKFTAKHTANLRAAWVRRRIANTHRPSEETRQKLRQSSYVRRAILEAKYDIYELLGVSPT